MKSFLRLLCLGLAASTAVAGFSQAEDVTSKVKNHDMELGIKYWNVDGEATFGKVTKNQISRPGYHGINNIALENWNGSGAGLGDNYVSQTLRDLPAGTYVLGAYIAATIQTDNVESNRDDVSGVFLFANENRVEVATDNPDKSEYKWAHSGKFNVATTLTEPGNIRVGIKMEGTTANFVIFDNVTLHYFGDMSEADALNEMAKIDMGATVSIADTCLTYKMHVDTLAYLNEQIAAAKAVTTADAAWQADEDLYWAIRLANKSIADYRSYANAIARAERVLAGDWSAYVTTQYEALKVALAKDKEVYEAATLLRTDVEKNVAALKETTALVELDSLYNIFDEVDEFITKIDEEELAGEDPGMLSSVLVDSLRAMRGDADLALVAAMAGEKSALETAEYIVILRSLMKEIVENPNAVDEFPLTVTREDGLPGVEISGQYHWESRLYSFASPVGTVRFTVSDSNTPDSKDGSGYICFALAEFFMKDANGETIELSADMIKSNADHNDLNGGKDGQSIPGMVDGDPNTFFHSTWGTGANGTHYIEVTLPEGKYSSFSFGFISRNWRTTPVHIEISTISEWQSYLLEELNIAKGMHAYHGAGAGFYAADLTPLYEAIDRAEALVGVNASDEELKDAVADLQDARDLVTEELEYNYPESGRVVRFISAMPGYYKTQGVYKAITMNPDSKSLWWETYDKEKKSQEFLIEEIPNEDGEHYYKLQHVESGLWVNRFETSTKLVLTEEADTIELAPLGGGQFNLMSHGSVLHTNWHNNGAGVSEGICTWGGGYNTASSWYVLAIEELPLTRLVEGAVCYEDVILFEGANVITLTADKACAFDGLTIYDFLGNKLDAEISASGNSATFILNENHTTFGFKFNNPEGITSVVVSGGMSKIMALQTAYDEAVADAPQQGLHVMQYPDLSKYYAALAAAEKLLDEGGTDEEIDAVVNQLKTCMDGLTPNMPDPDRTYFIISGLEAFEENHGVPMMMYAGKTEVLWGYENTDEQSRYWKFIPAEVEESAPAAYYIQNVATGTCIGEAPALVSLEAAIPYNLKSLGGIHIGIDKQGKSDRLHANWHSEGGGKSGNIVYWGGDANTPSSWKICETESYLTDIDFTQIEESNDEKVSPAVKGIYDLFGRRVMNPTHGIYIIDGKKKLVK